MELSSETTSLALAFPLLKVPCENLNKVFRNIQRDLEKEISTVKKSIKELGQ
jgi:hypothetical protein